MDIEQEIWKDVKDFEGMYQVSNMGRVKSLDRIVVNTLGHIVNYKGRILRPLKIKQGYLHTRLCKNCVEYSFRIHRLVAQHFIPNPENKKEVNHLKGIKTDNRASQLEWCTSSENMRHAVSTKLKVAKKGSNSPYAKPVYQFSLDGFLIGEYGSGIDAQDQTGIQRSSICFAIKGRYTQAGGFKWSH